MPSKNVEKTQLNTKSILKISWLAIGMNLILDLFAQLQNKSPVKN